MIDDIKNSISVKRDEFVRIALERSTGLHPTTRIHEPILTDGSGTLWPTTGKQIKSEFVALKLQIF